MLSLSTLSTLRLQLFWNDLINRQETTNAMFGSFCVFTFRIFIKNMKKFSKVLESIQKIYFILIILLTFAVEKGIMFKKKHRREISQ